MPALGPSLSVIGNNFLASCLSNFWPNTLPLHCPDRTSRPSHQKHLSLSFSPLLNFTMSLSAPGGPINPEEADNYEEIEKQFAVKGALGRLACERLHTQCGTIDS